MTPSETLRAAAARIRALAAKATEGPWRWNGTDVDVVPTTKGAYIVAAAATQEGEPIFDGDGAWIATMSPVVAEPLAAWLEDTALLIDQWLLVVSAAAHALAFARSILEQP